MDDDRVWAFEASLWKADAEHYQDCIDPEVRMALPTPPFLFEGEQAIEAVAGTPRWSNVAFEDGTISRPQEGLIVVAYTAHAQRAGQEKYVAHCTSTYRKDEQGEWQVIQHQQTPRLVAGASS
ncbi:DUF4440 domain-containing protein [Sphingomonas sp.]|jgi:hypothetical protein|uniref:DUF4440 domain-containing protein n=1 Tax=Sphingomonas sp. TaxID=28214 RepID=UPI002DF051F7|nr:DUF4440 domain-containing protein [Sphingomonas sp.]